MLHPERRDVVPNLPPPHRPTAGPSSVFLLLVVLAWVMIVLFFFAPRGSWAALGIAIGIFVSHATWLRNAWREVPAAYRSTAPGKPVDPEGILPLLLIPIYNLYLIYTLHVGLCEVVDAMLVAYGRPRRAKRGLAVTACTLIACTPFIPFGLVFLAAHMRSMDGAIDAMRQHTYRGWPPRAPEPPVGSFVKWALPTVIGGFLLGSVAAPYAVLAMRGISGAVLPRRQPDIYAHPTTLARKLAEGVMRCQAQKGELPPSSTVLVPKELRRLGSGYTPKRDEWLADPTFACADYAPTEKMYDRPIWRRESAQIGRVTVEDYKGSVVASVDVSCGEDYCIGKGSPNGWTVHDPRPYKPPSSRASSVSAASSSSAGAETGPSSTPRTGNATLEPIVASRASRLEELRGVEGLQLDIHGKLTFPDGQPILRSTPAEVIEAVIRRRVSDYRVLMKGSAEALQWNDRALTFGPTQGAAKWTHSLAIRAAALDPVPTGDGFVFAVDNGGVQRWRVGRFSPEQRFDDTCAPRPTMVEVVGERIFLANELGAACTIDRGAGTTASTFSASGSGLHSFSIFGRTPLVAAVSSKGSGLRLWDAQTGQAKATVSADSAPLDHATYSTSGEDVVTIANGNVVVYDMPSGALRTSMSFPKAKAVALRARTIAVLDDAGDVWITEDRETPRVRRSCGAGASRVALSRDGYFLMCGKTLSDHVFAQRTP